MMYKIIKLNVENSTFEILYEGITKIAIAEIVVAHAIKCDKEKNDVILIMPTTLDDNLDSQTDSLLDNIIAERYKRLSSKYNIISLSSGGNK